MVRGIWKWESAGLPKYKTQVSLGEGDTPLRFSERLDLADNLFLKDESQNPTNSFRDRGSAVIVSDAIEKGAEKVIVASSGNEAASMSAYCAFSNLECLALMPDWVDLGKLAQVQAFGAEIRTIGKNVDDAIQKAKELCETTPNTYQGTPDLNRLSLDGQQTIAWEIIEQISDLGLTSKEMNIVAPMGSGSLVVSLWKGFQVAIKTKMIEDLPRIIGVKHDPQDRIRAFAISGSLQMETPSFEKEAQDAIDASKGYTFAASDEDLIDAAQMIAQREGIFVEPSSAASIFGVKMLQQEEEEEGVIVAILTSSGLKALEGVPEARKRRRFGQIEGMSTKLEILNLIDEGRENYGKSIHEYLSKGRKITHQAVYLHLKELEINGLIKRETMNRPTTYSLTEKGEKLISHMREVEKTLR